MRKGNQRNINAVGSEIYNINILRYVQVTGILYL